MASLMTEQAWTDGRLDDLNAKVDRLDERIEAGFAETRTEFRAVRSETAKAFAVQNAVIVIGFLGVIATVLTQT
jgi:hypothetical protein